MRGFDLFFNESLTDFAIEAGMDIHGPSILQAVEDLISDKPNVQKYASMIDTILGLSHMLSLVKPTYKTNLQILFALKDVLKHPKKTKYWKKLGYYLWKSGKLTVANPLIFMPMVTPMVSFMPIDKQAIALGSIKFISTIYSYLSSLADNGKGGEAVQTALQKIKFALPDIEETKKD